MVTYERLTPRLREGLDVCLSKIKMGIYFADADTQQRTV
jgi:hypothetical protein